MSSDETVARLREQYPEGARVELVSMADPYTTLLPGDKGRVGLVDDIGTIFVDWDNGSKLGILNGVDKVKRIENEIKYETGADFWRDILRSHGLEEGIVICGRYLSAQIKTDSREEKQFCRELFTAMYEDTARRSNPDKLVYPYDLMTAKERTEIYFYHNSRMINTECAQFIDDAIYKSCRMPNYYNLDMAVMSAVHDYGFERVKAILTYNISERGYDGRFSDINKEWAAAFDHPENAFESAILHAHPILVDGFTKDFRRLYDDLGAERFALPGRDKSGHAVHGYEIIRSISFDDQRGFAIGHNPEAVLPYVAWQFTAENGKQDYYWGNYFNNLTGAAGNYAARVIVHMSGGDIREVYNPLAAAEMSAEQNYNMIDGVINNEKPRADLTDGQTYEEIAELAPETLPQSKTSVLEKIREAKKEPSAPRRQKDGRSHEELSL
jgi:hypothetical protein